MYTAAKFIAPILNVLESLSLLKFVMVICMHAPSVKKILKSTRSYHLKLHCRIEEQGTLTIQKSTGLEYPLTLSSCILVAEVLSSTALVADLDPEPLCNSLLMSISYKQ